MKRRTFFMILFCFATLTPAFGNNASPLDKAEALITELKFYDALIALEPLLTANQKSEGQEKALWLANTLCNQLMRSLFDEFWEIELDPLLRKFWDEIKTLPNPQRRDVALKWEKAAALNRLGANITYDEFRGYWSRYGFLRRLVTLYPNSSWRPAAEYYLIQEEYLPIDERLAALHNYVEKYAKSGLAEVYMAYLDIAHLNHGLWAVLAHPDGPYGRDPEINSDDPEKDKQRAVKCKTEALKYYAKFIARYGNIARYESKNVIESFEELKQDKESGYSWIYSD